MMEYMIWFDNNGKKSFSQRVNEGADYFERKYGRRAGVCLVSPKDFNPNTILEREGERIRIVADSRVLINHFWLGEEVNQDAN
jgi:hypothetical protein